MAKIFSGLALLAAIVASFFGFQSKNLVEKLQASAATEHTDLLKTRETLKKTQAELKDTHDFFPLLRKFGVAREQALRLADRNCAFQVPTETYKYILHKASQTGLPIMVFVGNDGIIQIHTGEVEKVLEARGWINVMDERFNLHINQTEIASAWIVKKPTDDGVVSSLEIFNRHGENVALFFGKRKPGIPEKEEWRELLATVKAL